MSTLLIIDNYDSFTYNLVQQIAVLDHSRRSRICVVRNNALTLSAALELCPAAIVISPGPGRPEAAGITLPLIQAALDHSIPLLGVCLGHQAIAECLGGKTIHAPHPMHGETSLITHSGTGLFKNIPQPCQVMRYHSLITDCVRLPAALHVDASTRDGLVMGFHHRDKPVWGVQFHPESFLTSCGNQLMQNFLELAFTHAQDSVHSL